MLMLPPLAAEKVAQSHRPYIARPTALLGEIFPAYFSRKCCVLSLVYMRLAVLPATARLLL